MSADLTAGRRYSASEIDRILAEATRFDSAQGLSVAPGDGLTLSQIIEVARDVGISAHAVTAAAGVLGANSCEEITSPTAFRRAYVMQRALGESSLHDVVRSLRQLPGQGTLNNVPGSVQWQSVTREGASTTIDVRSEAGATSVVLYASRERDLLGLLCVGGAVGMVAGLAGAGLVGAAPGPELIAIVAAGTASGLATGVGCWRQLKRRWQQRLATMFLSVTREVLLAADTSSKDI